jgi:RNA polymerase sigma factor (sigma-70 family)
MASVSELSRKSGVSANSIGDLVNLRVTPINKFTGGYRDQIWRLAEALYCHPDDMFTDRQRTTFMASNRRCVEMAEAEIEQRMAALETMAPDEHVLQIERRAVVDEAMLTRLAPRQRRVIELRYGIGGGEELTYDQISELIGVSKERVRQIEMGALRRLHRPLRVLAEQMLPQVRGKPNWQEWRPHV